MPDDDPSVCHQQQWSMRGFLWDVVSRFKFLRVENCRHIAVAGKHNLAVNYCRVFLPLDTCRCQHEGLLD